MRSTDYIKGDRVRIVNTFKGNSVSATKAEPNSWYKGMIGKVGEVVATDGSMVGIDIDGTTTWMYPWRISMVTGFTSAHRRCLSAEVIEDPLSTFFDEAIAEELAKSTEFDYSDPFESIANEMVDLHNMKGKDYGTKGDPYANVRAAEAFGLPAWMGVAIRMNDKMRRLQTAAQQYLDTGEISMQFDGVMDDFRDLAVYGIIGQIMFMETKEVQT